MIRWLLFLAVIALAACDRDIADVGPVTDNVPVVNPERQGAMAIAHGASFAIQPWMSHEELEGSDALPITGVRADDPKILEVRPTSHAYTIDLNDSPNGLMWVLVGVSPGQTTIRFYRDDDEVGACAVDVIEQEP